MNKNIDKLIRNLRKKVEEEAIPYCTERIDFIIKNKVKSIKEIEEILDSLLDYMDLGYGINEFKRLNKYYSTFQKEKSESYNQFYREWKERNA